MQFSNQDLTNSQALIPRVKFKKRNQVLREIQISSTNQAATKQEQAQNKQQLVVSPANIYYKSQTESYKENIQAIIIEKKKMEIQKRNDVKNMLKLDYNSYGRISIGSDTLNPKSQKPLPSSKNNNSFMMDNYCLKMSESIILSSDTIDSDHGNSPPLNNDSFERIKFLGKGKFGKVYLVVHKSTGFVCAMKIIDKSIVREQQVQQQIIKQIKIHSILKAMNVISFYGFFNDPQYFYILLEYATQGCLISKFKDKNRLEQEQIKPIIKGVCQGLKYIHKMGYVHRDIKPENIVMQFGVPKICDFGWASTCDDINLCSSYCGTPLYLSPQMIKRELYGSSVDIWAMGLLAYQLLVGRVPFSIWSEQDLILILTSQINIPEYIDRSQACESFIIGSLQKQALERLTIEKILSHRFIEDVKNKTDFQIYQKVKQLLN